ncbi:MAG: protein kinase [Thermoanaerobaculales bacterium]
MNVQPGSQLGNYQVLELIGEGGMGSVYRANDTRLRRQVALKVVRSPFAEDSDRVARLTREAQLLASLSHPHIATIHGLEEFDGVRFLVLELVPGVGLAERVARGPLPVHEALVLAAQIAGAVEAAHDRGVIHRDLKPANIKITPDGSVKVLDFGLAKALAPDPGAPGPGGPPTLTSAGTAEGTILGTAAYMSPEQARGAGVDKRTDIWAFGCVLFEMLTGRVAFAGGTGPDTIVAILTRDPDWAELPGDVPTPIRLLLRRMLVKDPSHRLRDIGDARIEIEESVIAAAAPAGSATRTQEADRAIRRNRALFAGGVFAVAALAAAAAWMLKPLPSRAGRSTVEFALPLPTGEHLDGLDFPAVAMSPAETHVVYVASRGGQRRLLVRTLSVLGEQPIPATEGALSPFFSPDGEWIGFFADDKLKKVPVTGGPVRTICDVPIGFGGAWERDGTIIYAPGNGSALWEVPADGGTPHAVTKLDTARGEFSHRWPELLPGADAVLYTVGTEGTWDDAEIVVQSLKSGERHTVVEGGSNPKYLPDGRLLYVHRGAVFALPFDTGTLRATAGATPLLTGVLESSDGAMELSISRSGSVVYVTGASGTAGRTLAWVDRQGNVQPLAAPERQYSSPRLSPDGRTLAVTITGADRDDVWTYDIAHNALAQITFEVGSSPVWTSDGRRIIFNTGRGGPPGLFWKQADGSGPEERLTRRPRMGVPNSSSPDGRTTAFVEYDPTAGRHILLLDSDSRGVRAFSDKSAANETAPAFSPDGQWLAYVSDETGHDEVYVASIKNAARRMRVSADGGSEPVWRRDGSELFFRSGNRMMAAAVTLHPSMSVSPARALFEGAFYTGEASRPAYDVSADGARFLMVTGGEGEWLSHELRVILGWKARPHAAR